MSKNKYRISKQAIDDLNDIWVYTFQNWSKKQADRYYDLIIEEIEFIADNYLTGKSAEQTRKNYRVTKIKSHLIFYRKVENEIVEIVRILHQRIDIKKRLK
ncbi:MAG: type II toxin-antitoxin system RelE/ParE family toxin [Algibacter sp.]|uniref:type II toxin-antitoxin system RelE/ParE family toxin n=1 Tax=Algibacter sp. TaxID=1872428 RepID=UPI002610174F|nr:type II toxin-antitoxin system RelE/ParE family toxin [Algibacter sp.]MDG1730299.1 type II toxin-antitoxin system RelE/ParE family toxin [Algibacter sp.]MDG2178927.1 type II toxin-antitoxin system RelE/ParE family toxin [Algibacter sp.]